MAHIYPSLMGADQLNLQKEIEKLRPNCHGFHIDIMDNNFVPNITWGADIVNAVGRIADCPLWVHLMVENPINWDDMLFLPKGSILSFHLESNVEIPRFIKQIRENNYKPSLAINPETPLESIFPILNAVDQILLMSVNPGFSGQPFLKESIERLDRLAAYRQTSKLNFRIGMDGGINKSNIKELTQKGVDDFAIAGGIFRTEDPIATLQELKKIVSE